MKQTRVTLLLLCATLLVLLLLPSMAHANESIKIVSWNIGAFTIEREYLDLRLEPMTQWLGKNDFDIIALQETHYGRKEGERIAARLEELGYGKFYVSKTLDPKSDTDVKRPGPGVYILSRFPIKSENMRPLHDDVNRSMMTIVELPYYGDVPIVTAHPSGNSGCKGPVLLLKTIDKFSVELKEKIIITGDMNSTIVNGDIRGDVLCKESGLISRFNYKCTDMANCHPPTDIDMIFTTSISKIPIESRKLDKGIHSVLDIPGEVWKNDVHWPISAVITLPTPPRKPEDLDANSVIDIFDYNILLGKFGATGAPGFHTADIIQNGVVDIFDYNKLIENFGK